MYKQIKATAASGRARPQALALFVTKDAAVPPPGTRSLDRAFAGQLSRVMQRPEFDAGTGQCTTIYPANGEAPAERLVLVGIGPREAISTRGVCLAAAALARHLAAAKLTNVRVEFGEALTAAMTPAHLGACLAHGMTSAVFTFDRFQGAAGRENRKALPTLTVRVPSTAHDAAAAGLIAGTAANHARELAATPPNVATPPFLVTHCRQVARKVGLSCKVIDAKRAARLGMGGLLAVGQGGSKPPCMIVLEWEGAKGKPRRATGASSRTQGQADPILLVGKAITFDTGGYSLKVGGTMKGMKYDKCGGTAVIGIMEAIAQLGVSQRVVALIACAENMIDTNAFRVDDIITLCNGVTVEVTNTDAEGRLVLADALAYGTRMYRPKAVFDLATLTGGVVVALGNHMAGAWCTDDALWHRVEKAAAMTGERAWRMPLDQSYRDMMKASHADLHNSAPVRAAHPIQGAAFLSHFVGEQAPRQMPTIPWCHLDIAGTATSDESNALHDKGPTGYGVRLLAELIRRW